LANSRLESHKGLVGRYSQVDNSVVQANILANIGLLAILALFSWLFFELLLILLVLNTAAGIFKLKR
jgi:hypothetical protein